MAKVASRDIDVHENVLRKAGLPWDDSLLQPYRPQRKSSRPITRTVNRWEGGTKPPTEANIA